MENLKRSVLPILGIILAGFLIIWIFSIARPHGTLYLSTTNELGPAVFLFSLEQESLTPLLPPEGIDTLIAAVPGERATAFQAWTGTARVLMLDSAVVSESAMVEIPAWSPDGSTIAFSELPFGADGTNPDAWVVRRAVLSGDSLESGNGYRPHPIGGDSVLALTQKGIVRITQDEVPEIVVQSAVPVTTGTPFVVSSDGARVAWVNPADFSLQVFEIAPQFRPLLSTRTVSPSSLIFAPDGTHIMVAEVNETDTILSAVSVRDGSRRTVTTLPGAFTLTAWTYE